MIYTDYQDKKLPLLGFGTMRLPVTELGAIDQEHLEKMVKAAMQNGVNYFDTAYPYHGGQSEIAIGRALRKYPRESWLLADKFPGHQILSSYEPAGVFEDQLKKCGVDYFDFYLLHNVYETSMPTYLDPKWGILDYFKEQKRLGRIKHLGFSSHGTAANLRAFLEVAGKDMEFCQIQLNWLDWTLQNAREKVEILKEFNIPVWVMEPLRGGKLCKLPEKADSALKALRPDETIPAWSFRYLQGIDNVQMVLSGMSTLEQMNENIASFAERRPLDPRETETLYAIAEELKDSVPCTACRYCTPHCPMGLDIPALLALYNEIRLNPAVNVGMRVEAMGPEQQPSVCIGCGACAQICPQSIKIPECMKDFAATMEKIPSWAEICRQRDEAQRALKK